MVIATFETFTLLARGSLINKLLHLIQNNNGQMKLHSAEGLESGVKPWIYKRKTGFTESFDLALAFWTSHTDPGKTSLYADRVLL